MKALYLTLFFVFFLATAAFAVININTATQQELTSLAGIGPVKAEAIVKYRQEKGLFKDINGLVDVYGIGKKTLERLKGDISVGETSSTTVEKKVTKEKQTGEEVSSKTPKK